MGSDKQPVKLTSSLPAERCGSIRLAGSTLGSRPHVCAFFQSPDDEYGVLLPFIKEGLELGEKAVHTLDPQRMDEHRGRLASAGIEVAALESGGQLELRDWANTHLQGGKFDPQKTLSLFEDVVKNAKQNGFSLIRFITHMEWALITNMMPNQLLEYEAKTNELWLRPTGPLNPIICTYDLRKFRGDIVVDVMRTHPLVLIGGILQENPFFVPPDEFLRELRGRRTQPNQSLAVDSGPV
jgi:hypothetical protein